MGSCVAAGKSILNRYITISLFTAIVNQAHDCTCSGRVVFPTNSLMRNLAFKQLRVGKKITAQIKNKNRIQWIEPANKLSAKTVKGASVMGSSQGTITRVQREPWELGDIPIGNISSILVNEDSEDTLLASEPPRIVKSVRQKRKENQLKGQELVDTADKCSFKQSRYYS